ncbi:ABC transporter permease [Brachybacterium alimentarium]|uniref:ABC-type polysaccharide transport system, permease component n=2 Tax=Brachybacterium TaxID=43668 RepID=C7MFS7_BRAFD|nr:ABC transporter permease subunit [Brachybacterium faecium]ACU84045.1 ABC-type polysaccharide transport system, permease component [Brachybacterium faecium DSM 4810]SLM89479.1 Xylose ABC transporter, permease component [Brachybacterium faecium]HJC69689.1 ABC transporter permease subunit [Candidatus Brachybacterium intestinipullorum]HJG51902.1 ABC transporter permease subunit [Brachybacterium faecium]
MTVIESADVAVEEPKPRRRPPKRRPGAWRRALRRDWPLYSLAVAPLIFLAIFRYVPMVGNIIAFRRFRPGGSIFGDEWVGTLYVEMFIRDPAFWNVFANTAIIGGMTLVVCFPLPIILALMLNEVRRKHFKKIVQSISYLPHFLSVVIVVGMVYQLLSLQGTVNQIREAFGGDPVSFLQQAEWFRFIYVASEAWQTVGWGTILYLAALTAVDDALYEAARIDGANRWQQTWHVTIPGIRPTMVTLLILNIGNFLNVGFEKVLLLYNPMTYSTGDVISTYLYRVGLVSNNLSYAAAIGLFQAIIGFVMVMSANYISKRLVGTSLW